MMSSSDSEIKWLEGSVVNSSVLDKSNATGLASARSLRFGSSMPENPLRKRFSSKLVVSAEMPNKGSDRLTSRVANQLEIRISVCGNAKLAYEPSR